MAEATEHTSLPPVIDEPSFVLSPELSSSLSPEPSTQGITLHPDGTSSFRVWAPHAASVLLRIKEGHKEVHLNRDHDNFDMWSLRLAPGALSKGSAYKVLICTHDGQKLERWVYRARD